MRGVRAGEVLPILVMDDPEPVLLWPLVGVRARCWARPMEPELKLVWSEAIGRDAMANGVASQKTGQKVT